MILSGLHGSNQNELSTVIFALIPGRCSMVKGDARCTESLPEKHESTEIPCFKAGCCLDVSLVKGISSGFIGLVPLGLPPSSPAKVSF
tara:strand:+ start:29 stop:292 length:264 start_codon:yes stop_codon:yes gene_type:complete